GAGWGSGSGGAELAGAGEGCVGEDVVCFAMVRRALRATLFPYTTLFRSVLGGTHARVNQVNRADFGNVAGFTCTSITIVRAPRKDRKSTRLNSSHGSISYAVFCLTNKTKPPTRPPPPRPPPARAATPSLL